MKQGPLSPVIEESNYFVDSDGSFQQVGRQSVT